VDRQPPAAAGAHPSRCLTMPSRRPSRSAVTPPGAPAAAAAGFDSTRIMGDLASQVPSVQAPENHDDTELPEVPATALLPGTDVEPAQKVAVLGDFRLLQKLGAGAMGAVYRAYQISVDRPGAVKVMSRHLAENKAFVDRFYREARLMAKLDHPHI